MEAVGFGKRCPPPHLCIFVCEMYNREAVIVSGGGGRQWDSASPPLHLSGCFLPLGPVCRLPLDPSYVYEDGRPPLSRPGFPVGSWREVRVLCLPAQQGCVLRGCRGSPQLGEMFDGLKTTSVLIYLSLHCQKG